jgi:hypothetical protein
MFHDDRSGEEADKYASLLLAKRNIENARAPAIWGTEWLALHLWRASRDRE